MSILIKGMEMPVSCWDCPMSHISCNIECSLACELLGEDIEEDVKRLKNCPLIEVLTPHGRLIDADALYNHMVKVHKEWVENPELHNSVIQTIDDETMLQYAPTIIEEEIEI